ncbi:MAG TPA: Plug domain-containing protein, partial [Opitutaceae bacterium]|nr:Plug domain-containing protein [Opitutaceae bacterium]
MRSTIATHTVATVLLTILASSAFPQTSQVPARSEATRLSPMVISTSRMPTPVDELPVTVDLFSRERMLASPALTLDATLRESAAFSLFRRSSGLTANPTAQGVSLRGLGPSGASRSLVLLDGIPLNDPFGGWVAWYKVPRLSLAGAEIMRGGGSGIWGNAALGGTLALTSRPLTESEGSLAINGGDFSTYLGETSLTQTLANGSAVRLDAAAFSTDGFYTVGPDQRGAIDRRLDSEFQLVQFTWKQPLQSDIFLQIAARGFREDRGNGTPLQQN